MWYCGRTRTPFKTESPTLIAAYEALQKGKTSAMTSAQAQELARLITKNDPEAVRPLIQLIYGLRESRGDPAIESLMSDVIGTLYIKTEHCDKGIKAFVSLAA